MRRHEDALGMTHESTVDAGDLLLRRDIAYYQGASHAFRKHLMDWSLEGHPG